MRRVAIVSDTHIPDREREIPAPLRDQVQASDLAIHAGDFRSLAVVTQVEKMVGGDLTAVYGNADPRAINLPAVAVLPVEDVTFVITHGHDGRGKYRDGGRGGYGEYLSKLVRDRAGPDAVGVYGHTHTPEDRIVDGIRLLNPGSATGARPADRPTMMTVDVDGADLDVTVHEA